MSAPDHRTAVHKRRVLRTVDLSLVLLLVCTGTIVVAKKIFISASVYGRSMAPTLYPGEYILGVRVPQRCGLLWQLIRSLFIKRGAIVLARPPAHLGRLEVKRVDGVAGDLRSWGWGASVTGPHRIPNDHVFLIGDGARYRNKPIDKLADMQHRDKPTGPPADSRLYGPCPSIAVVARVFLRFWPITRFGYLN